jgi:hypothetical protein
VGRGSSGPGNIAGILLLAGGSKAGAGDGDCRPAGAGTESNLHKGREGGILGAEASHFGPQRANLQDVGLLGNWACERGDNAEECRTVDAGEQGIGARAGVWSPLIRADGANAGPSAEKSIVQGASQPAVRAAEGVLGLQERIRLSAGAHTGTVERGAVMGLELSSGRRESRWQGEGKRLDQGRASRKGRERELGMQDTSSNKKKGSSEAAVGTSEQEPD